MASISIIAYKYTPLRDGTIPLKIRISKDRKEKYISLNISVKKEHWDFKKQQPKNSCPDKEIIQNIISEKLQQVHNKITQLTLSHTEYTASSLVDILTKPTKPQTVEELFQQYIAMLNCQNRLGYMLSVKRTYNCLIKFNHHLNIPFSHIDITFLRNYETYLIKKHNSVSSIGIKFRTLRVIYNLAIEQGTAKQEQYPFKKYKLSKLTQTGVKRALTKEQVHAVINYKATSYYAQLAVDIFAFSYYMGGINFTDIARLTREHIIDQQLIYYRTKTHKLISLPLSSKAEAIIQKHSPLSSLYLFPILNDLHKTESQKANRIHKVITKVNRELKTIGKELKLPVKLTTYTARHSYATVLKRAGIPVSTISETLGHSSEKVTKYYLDSFENEQVKKAMKNL